MFNVSRHLLWHASKYVMLIQFRVSDMKGKQSYQMLLIVNSHEIIPEEYYELSVLGAI